MSQPHKQAWRKLRPCDVRASDVDNLLSTFSALDRFVVEISMHINNVPRRDRAAKLAQHHRLHDTIREGLPRFLCQPERST